MANALDLNDLNEAIAGVLGWHIDDTELPKRVREEHNIVITAARAYRDLLANGERMEPDYEAAAKAAYDRAVSDSEHGFPHPGSYDEPKARGHWWSLARSIVDAALAPTTNEDE